jgi:hypothetical protein
VTFKPGKEMEDRVKELERQATAARAARPKSEKTVTATSYNDDGKGG